MNPIPVQAVNFIVISTVAKRNGEICVGER